VFSGALGDTACVFVSFFRRNMSAIAAAIAMVIVMIIA
jgi:hypothetical protein